MSNPHLKTLSAAIALLFASHCAVANGDNTNTMKTSENHLIVVKQLQPIIVEAGHDNLYSSYSGQALHNLPNPSNTIAGLLVGDSQVTFDPNSTSGYASGEIHSPQISMVGGTPTDNAYVINGITNNNLLTNGAWSLNPNWSFTSGDGGSEALEISPELFKRVTVYTRNIPVDYDSFTAGVIDAQLVDAQVSKWQGNVRGTYQNSHWDSSFDQNLDTNSPLIQEPQAFIKSNLGGTITGPIIKDKLGILLDYQRTHSDVTITPLWAVDGHPSPQKVHRNRQNFLLKVNTVPDAITQLGASLIYEPYKSQNYAQSHRSGYRTIEGGGLNLILEGRHKTAYGELKGAISLSENKIDITHTENQQFTWSVADGNYAASFMPDSRIATEGGRGQYQQHQRNLVSKLSFDFNPIGENITHHIRVGAQLQLHHLKTQNSYFEMFLFPQLSKTVLGEMTEGVIAHEQFLKFKDIYLPGSRAITYRRGFVWMDDEIKYNRYTLRPGLAISYNSVSKRADLSPRIVGDIDVLNNDQFHITAGAARYIGNELLNYALALPLNFNIREMGTEDSNTHQVTRKKLMEKAKSYKELDKVKSPYSNELSLGASAVVPYLGKVNIDLLHRSYKNLIVFNENDTATNNGERKYDAVTLEIEKTLKTGQWGEHRFGLSATYQKEKSNRALWFNPTDFQTPFDTKSMVLNNQEIAVKDLDLSHVQFKPQWVIAFTHRGRFFDGKLITLLRARYEGSQWMLNNIGMSRKDTKFLRSYTLQKIGHNFTVDLGLVGTIYKHGDITVQVTGDISNLFNRKNPGYVYTGNYFNTVGEPRRFTLGLKANF